MTETDPVPSTGADPLSTQLFVGGLQRSGTTLLASLLSQNPVVTGLRGTGFPEDEGQFVQRVYLSDDFMGRRQRKGGEVGRSMRWAYHPEAHLTEADARERSAAGTRLLESWWPYIVDQSRPVLLEKSPSNVARTRFLQAAFGDARFVIVTRHPLMQALAVRKWGTNSTQVGLAFDKIIDHWLTAMDMFTEDFPLLRNVAVTSYERLMHDPATTLTDVADLVGLPAFAYETGSVREASASYVRYLDNMRRGRMSGFTSLNNRRRLVQRTERLVVALLGPLTMKRIEKRYGSRMAAYGYAVDDLTHCHRSW